MPFDEPGTAVNTNKGEKVKHVGSFKILHILGKGSFCTVRLATHIVSGQQFAVKVIKPAANLQWHDVEREIAVLRILNHPNIIRLHQVLYTDENKVAHGYVHHGPRPSWPPRKLYMFMELAEGGELFDYIISRNHLPEDEARRLFRQILGGLEYMHSHLVVHRDLKPENIVIDSKRNIKINDFGLSCTITPGARLKNFCGSPVYAAPEILKKKNYDGATADIWSLGVMLFTMVTGHLPWKPSNSSPENYFNMLQGRFTIPPRIRVSSECYDIIKRMLNPEAKKRATIRDLRNHPWTNEGFADRPPAFHHNYPPVPLDNVIVKKMVQMGYSSKEVQAIVMNNETSPILTTYHAIRNLSIEAVPSLSLQNQDLNALLPYPRIPVLSLSTPIPPPSSSIVHSNPIPISTSHFSDHNHGNTDNNGNNDDNNALSTPPLLRLARDLPPEDSNEDNIQFNSADIDSPTSLTHLEPFADYRAKPGEPDYDSTFTPSSPPLPTSHSFPNPHHTPPASPRSPVISTNTSRVYHRHRGESDPPVHHHEEERDEKDEKKVKEKDKQVADISFDFSLTPRGPYDPKLWERTGADVPPSPREWREDSPRSSPGTPATAPASPRLTAPASPRLTSSPSTLTKSTSIFKLLAKLVTPNGKK